jgi:hypothetical protein
MSNLEQVSALLDEETQSLLSAIGNHEAKALAAAVINSKPDEGYSIRQLETEMVARQGDDPAWRINSGTLADYCSRTLLPIGVVAREEEIINNRSRRVFQATEFGTERGLPFAGAVMEWSLAHPRNSVQQLLGITAVSGEAARSPALTFLLMQELVTSPQGKEISVSSIVKSLGEGIDGSRVIEDHLRRLEGEGFVELRTVVQDYNPIYTFDRDKADEITLTNDVSVAVREVLNDSPSNEQTLGEILELISNRHPKINLSDARRLLTYVTPGQRLPFLTLKDMNGTPTNQSAALVSDAGESLMKHYIDAVEASFDDSETFFRSFALDTISDPARFRFLMAKAREASNSTTSALSRNTVIGEIKEAGEISVAALRESLALKGHKVGSASLRRHLAGLVDAGLLVTSSKPLSKDLRRSATHYQVANV